MESVSRLNDGTAILVLNCFVAASVDGVDARAGVGSRAGVEASSFEGSREVVVGGETGAFLTSSLIKGRMANDPPSILSRIQELASGATSV